jgi:WD40 repeat protein/tetratricopeptide (TPR) repeat protein
MRAEHTNLLRRRRFHDNESAFLDEVRTFIGRGYATGVVLGDEAERSAAQSLITFWSNVYYRSRQELPDEALAEFDLSQAPKLDDVDCPYVRLEALPENRHGQFAGWQRLIAQGLKTLEEQRLVAVVGGPGSGRSSLVHGGLLPTLLGEKSPEKAAGINDLKPMVPGKTPLLDLLRHLLPDRSGDQAWAEQQIALVRNDPGHFTRLLEVADKRPAVLVVEDFEQLFQHADRQEARLFAEALLNLTRGGALSGGVVLVARADCLSQVAALGEFGKVFQRGQVLMLFSNAELRQLIEDPARGVGLHFDDGVVDRLLLDVQGDPAALTLLQFTLLQLWDHREGNRISHDLYDRLGGGRLALARQAEEVFASLTAEERDCARTIFLTLVQPDARAGIVCPSVTLEQLHARQKSPVVTDRVLRRLLDGRLVRRSVKPHPEEDKYYILHEAVALAWPRFIEWLDEARDRRRSRLRLHAAAEQWQQQKKHYLALWRGPVLEQALADLQRPIESNEELAPLDKEFLEESEKSERVRKLAWWAVIAGAVALLLVIACLVVVGAMAREAATTKNKQKLQLTMADRSIAEGMRQLESDDDASGALLWFLDAWKRFADGKETLSDEQAARQEQDYQVRLGLALRRLPRLTQVAYHDKLAKSAFTEDGSFAVTVGQDDGIVKLRNLNTGAAWDQKLIPSSRVPGEYPTVNHVCLSSDGRFVVVSTGEQGAADGQAYVWDTTDTGGAARPPLAHPGRVTFAAFWLDPNNSHHRLATVAELPTQESVIRLWDMETGEQETKDGLRYPGAVNHLAFRPDGKRLVVAGSVLKESLKDHWKAKTGVCFEWNLVGPITPEPYRRYQLRHAANYVAFSPTSSSLAIVGGEEGDPSGEFWLVPDHGQQREQFPRHRGSVVHAAFSPDGRKVVTASFDGTAMVWTARRTSSTRATSVPADGDSVLDEEIRETAIASRILAHQGYVYQANFSPDGQYVITASRDRRAQVWDAQTGEPVHAPLQHGGTVSAATFAKDGGHVLTASEDMVQRWELTQGDPLPVLLQSAHLVERVTCDLKSRRVVVTWKDQAGPFGWARVWDAVSGKPLSQELLHPRHVTGALLDPHQAHLLVTVCEDGRARIWNVGNGKCIAEFEPHKGCILNFAAFSPDGRLLVTGAWNPNERKGKARLWAVTKVPKPVCEELTHDAPVTSAAFSPKGDLLVTVTGDKNINQGEATIWKVPSGERKRSLRMPRESTSATAGKSTTSAHKEAITHVAFSPDGERIITASTDDTARVWKVADGTSIALGGNGRPGHSADVIFAAFGEGGKYVVTASMDRTAIIWDSEGKHIAILEHKGWLNYAAFSRDERYVVTASRDGTARVWAVENGGLVAVKKHSGEVLFAGFLPNGDTESLLSLNYDATSDAAGRTLSSRPAPTLSRSPSRVVAVNHWSLAPEVLRLSQELEMISPLLAARQLDKGKDEQIRMRLVKPGELFQQWSRCKEQGFIVGSAPSRANWHAQEAFNCETHKRWYAAVWHLNQLIREEHKDASLYLRRANAFLQIGETDQALADYDAVIAKDPGNAAGFAGRAHLRYSRALSQPTLIGDAQLAVDDFTQAIKLDPNEKTYLVSRAQTYFLQKAWEKAVGDYKAALRLDGNDRQAKRLLTEVYLKQPNWRAAISVFDDLINDDPNNVEQRIARAGALEKAHEYARAAADHADVARQLAKMGKLEQAQEEYKKALAHWEGNPAGLHAELGSVHSKAGNSAGAIDEYKQAIKGEPRNWEHWSGLGGAYERSAQSLHDGPKAKESLAAAENAYCRAIDLAKEEPSLYQSRALVRMRLQKYELAAEDYTKVIERGPQKSWLLQQRAQAYARLGKWDKVAQDYTAAIQLEQNSIYLRLRLAELYVEAAKFDDAVRCLEEVAASNRNDLMSVQRLAFVYLMNKDKEGYGRTCARLLDQFGNVPVSQTANNVAWACVIVPDAVKDPERVVQLAKRAVAGAPGYRYYLNTLAFAFYRADQPQEVIKLLEGVLTSSRLPQARPTGSPYVEVMDRLVLAMSCHKLGRAEESQRLLKDAVGRLEESALEKSKALAVARLNVWERFELQLIRREAESLINPATGSGK